MLPRPLLDGSEAHACRDRHSEAASQTAGGVDFPRVHSGSRVPDRETLVTFADSRQQDHFGRRIHRPVRVSNSRDLWPVRKRPRTSGRMDSDSVAHSVKSGASGGKSWDNGAHLIRKRRAAIMFRSICRSTCCLHLWLVLNCALGAPAQEKRVNQLTPQQAAEGWLLLWDGESTFGWESMGGAAWKVGGDSLQASSGTDGWLRHKTAFADFVLRLEFRMNTFESDSGVFIRAAKDGDPTKTGYQINITCPIRRCQTDLPMCNSSPRRCPNPSHL